MLAVLFGVSDKGGKEIQIDDNVGIFQFRPLCHKAVLDYVGNRASITLVQNIVNFIP